MAPQIGFPGLAPRSRAHLCFTMVEGSNRRREEGDVSRGFRVPRATDWQGPIGFFVASPFPTWRRTHFPSTLNSCSAGNCQRSRGRPRPSPLPGGISIVGHPSLLPCGNPVLRLLPTPAPVILPQRGSWSSEPLLSSTRLENGVPTPAPGRRCVFSPGRW